MVEAAVAVAAVDMAVVGAVGAVAQVVAAMEAPEVPVEAVVTAGVALSELTNPMAVYTPNNQPRQIVPNIPDRLR